MLQSAIHSTNTDMFSSGSHSLVCSSKEQLMLRHATLHCRIPPEAPSELEVSVCSPVCWPFGGLGLGMCV